MSKKRTLTEAEKRRVHDVQMAIERNQFPDHKIDIAVFDETDDDGNPRLTITKSKVTIMPPGWEPR